MEKPSIKCALLATLVAKHRWGSPMSADRLVSQSDVEVHEQFEAREVLDELRETSYLVSHASRGVELNNGSFDALADVLYHECDWEPFEVKLRLKHYEGWETHEWA
jgi:hypothetical protein